MKKFLIDFKFAGGEYSAKVHVNSTGDITTYKIAVLESSFDLDLESHSLIFSYQADEMQLLILKEYGAVHRVPWRIRAGYVSNEELQPEERFSLS